MNTSVLRTAFLRTAFALVLTLSGATLAQNAYQWESHDKRVTSAQTMTALGNDLFGDNISLQTGALSFTVTDVDLLGNCSCFALPRASMPSPAIAACRCVSRAASRCRTRAAS